MAKTARWSNLTANQRRAILGGVSAELVLTTIALVDLVRRPGTQIRGPKALWAASSVVQPVGPLAHLALGRRTAG